jgi:hypothetical protein
MVYKIQFPISNDRDDAVPRSRGAVGIARNTLALSLSPEEKKPFYPEF